MVQGNILLATYMAHRLVDDGILTFSLNPGGIKTELARGMGSFKQSLLGLLLFPAWMGAITQLYAGTSPKLTRADNGKYFIPWAREAKPRDGVQDITLAEKLWNFLEEDTQGKY
jgi:retinol dehydrogenase 12